MTIPGIYSQRDPRWAPIELGNNDVDGGDPTHAFNLYHYGCLVTALANMLWWNGNPGADPGAVNDWLIHNGGFEPDNGIFLWGKEQPLLDQVNMVQRGYSTDLNAVNAFLADENSFAIAWITKPGFTMHFSAMPFVDMIGDSWDAQLKHIEQYTFHGAHLYSKNAPIVVPAPAPETPPVQAPMVAPMPEPIPTVVVPIPGPTPPPPPTPPVPPTGQPNGDVTVTVQTAPTAPVLQDLPEFMETFAPFKDAVLGSNDKLPGREVHLLEDGVAVDLAGEGAPKALSAARPFRSSGTVTDGGHKYYRGTSGGWYAVHAENIAEEVPARTVAQVSSELSGFAQAVKDPIGMLIRFFSRLLP